MNDAGSDRLPLEEQLLAASELSDEGRWQEALALLLELEPDHSDNATLLCMVGVVADQLGSTGMAVDFFRRTLEQEPTDPQLLTTAGAGLAAARHPDAEAALRLAALSAPDYLPARMHYGAFLARAGLFDEAFAELGAAQELDPEDGEVRRRLGIAYMLAGRGAEAVAELEIAAAEAADDPEATFLFGLLLIQEGDASRAAEELYPLGEVLAEDAESQVLLALLFAAEGWENEAWLALSRAEAATVRGDPEVVREVEEAIEAGEEASRTLLLQEVVPSALRDRIAALA